MNKRSQKRCEKLKQNLKEEELKKINGREIHLIYEPPFVSLSYGVYTKLTTEDIINIYRQLKNPRIKKQLKDFVTAINKQQGIEFDIDTYKVSKVKIEEEHKRVVQEYKHNKEVLINDV